MLSQANALAGQVIPIRILTNDPEHPNVAVRCRVILLDEAARARAAAKRTRASAAAGGPDDLTAA
jgi:hypothetical protein